ncbi:chemotaxis protein CheR [Paracoccus liaowanqingii]|uniref:histidine kinase n=1 Tax=Paracoccus liaowanqingii TaxID=2560053 RepID=A0A4Z1BMM1_9RHOB|nr:chemotaxis protein CheR [Paracoccus liaowanqingii]
MGSVRRPDPPGDQRRKPIVTDRFPIVGIGASAGGIQAMEGLFTDMPADPGAAFVIVTHLSPDRDSLLPEIVARHTTMPVLVADDGLRVRPGHVYVMPPNVILTLRGGCLHQQPLAPGHRELHPVDIFLGALAEDQGEYAVAVILSGGAGDGTLGAKVVRERGGLTMAQTGDDGPFHGHGMPDSAIASGVIDLAIPVEEMGEKILAFNRSFQALAALTAEQGHADENRLDGIRQEIHALLRERSGHDFSGYKTQTFIRRVRRRMGVLQVDRIERYVQTLREDPDEAMHLFRDLLINVTNFLRDPEAFAALERQVLPKLFEGRGPGDTVRVWVPACATGEEVYSIAILMREQMDRLTKPPRVQIFATDIDERALTVARAARYPRALLDALTPERRQRFFTLDGASYALGGEVRELCVFSPHSVIRDPPFSRMDMVSCRNLLIYLGPDVQARVIPTFHYALKPGGYLFLGTSESISQHADLFTSTDQKSRIFQARDRVAEGYRLPMTVGGTPALVPAPTPPAVAGPRDPGRTAPHSLRHAVETQVLEKFSPPHVVVDGDGSIVYYSSRTGRYLEAPQGVPNRQILTMARKGLRLDLQSALQEAARSRRPVTRDNVMVTEDEDRVQQLTLIVEPLVDRARSARHYLVLFIPAALAGSRAELQGDPGLAEGTARLEAELRDTRERLQQTIEEYETSIEELKSSNEELASVNEEAQSTNEELEASKEEMQSLNEELSTINAELNGKLEELDRANSDLRNLFDSSRIATVFLDRKLVIRNFTPAASAFFNLRETDLGRPLTELSSTLDYPDLQTHIDGVFATGRTMEHKLPRDADGRHHLVRLLPYRRNGGRTDGVVVTLIDVTRLAEAEDHQQILISELNHRVKNVLAVVIGIVAHMLERNPTEKSFAEGLTGRLNAMARGYSLLSRNDWKDTSVPEIMAREAEIFGSDRFDLSGPRVLLAPQPGMSLGMVIHELATNAVKYGALGQPGGRIAVTWALEEGRLVLDWTETGGPPATPPASDGFRLFLIRGEICYRLRGEFRTWFDARGFRARIVFAVAT